MVDCTDFTLKPRRWFSPWLRLEAVPWYLHTKRAYMYPFRTGGYLLNLVCPKSKTSCATVLMGRRKAILLKLHYFHVLARPVGTPSAHLVEQKFHADFKNDLRQGVPNIGG